MRYPAFGAGLSASCARTARTRADSRHCGCARSPGAKAADELVFRCRLGTGGCGCVDCTGQDRRAVGRRTDAASTSCRLTSGVATGVGDRVV